MNINRNIMDTINNIENIYRIDINIEKYKFLKQETIENIKANKIIIKKSKQIKAFQIYIYKKDCFAFNNGKCRALKRISCPGCSFYKNNITWEKIEKDINNYSNNYEAGKGYGK